MALFIEINKVEEDSEEALYTFCTSLGNNGKVSIDKKSGECFIIEEPENDKESKLAIRVMIKLNQHWKKGEFPEETCWAS